jgi:LysM repeat protein
VAAPTVASATTANRPSRPVAHPAAHLQTFRATIVNVSHTWSTVAPRTAAVSHAARSRSYTVIRGDTLFAIASRTLGSGNKYMAIFDLNKNRRETGGEHFTSPNLIRVGWQLEIPTTASAATPISASHIAHTRSYTVARGDTLFGIASRTLGSGNKYMAIFDLNKNRPEPGGEHLTNPNLIRVGWQLEIPTTAASAATPTAVRSSSNTVSVYSNNLDGWIREAISILHAHGYVVSYHAIYETVMHESGGNPNAVNRSDSNAAKGTPSIGLMQTIQPTFDAYALPGHRNIYNPVDNIIAGAIYAQARYGGLDNVVAARCGGSCWYGY